MNDLYSAIINQLENGIIILDNKLNICLWNDWLVRLTGKSMESVQGLSVTKVIPRLDKRMYTQMFGQALSRGQKSFCSAAMHGYFVESKLDSSNKLKQNMMVRHIVLAEKRYVMLEIHDISNHYERIRRLNESLQRSIGHSKSLEQFAFYDSLTNLPNRKHIMDRLEELMKQGDTIFTLFFFDVNNFKLVNDHFGHVVGDKLLLMVANRLQQLTNDHMMVSRIGGDEFLLLAEDMDDPEQQKEQIRKINYILLEPFIIDHKQIPISVSIGYSSYPKEGVTVNQLLDKADFKMYNNKRRSKS